MQGDVLTVHEGSVLGPSLRITDEYNVRHYTKQRLELLELEMSSLFESDIDIIVIIKELTSDPG